MQGRIIRSARETLGLTQQGFADRLGVSQATVSRWESGQTEPDHESRRRIHALAGRSTHHGDTALTRMVRRAPSLMGLLDLNMRVLAVSDHVARLNAMDPAEAVGMDYRPLFTDDIAEAFEIAVSSGFFTGDVLGMDLACETRGLNGNVFPMLSSWHLLPRPSSGEPLLAWSAEVVDAESLAAARADGVARAVTVESWLDESAIGAVVGPLACASA